MATPRLLFNISLSSVVKNHSKFLQDIRLLPVGLQCDVYREMYNCGHIKTLESVLSDVDIIAEILKAGNKRLLLFCPLQDLLINSDVNVAVNLCEEYSCRVLQYLKCEDSKVCDKLVSVGISLGNLFADLGWFYEADKIFYCCLQLCKTITPVPYKMILLCHIRLVHIRTSNCQFSSAKDSYEKSIELASQLESSSGVSVNWIPIYLEKCNLLFALNQYREAYQECIKILTTVKSNLPVKIIVDILRISSKACVVKRKYKKAEFLITHAVNLARHHFGEHHPTYADCVIDFGFYLLNVDSINCAVQVYQNGLEIRKEIFGDNNIYVAMVHEDLGYATYVQEYSSGEFDKARQHAQMSIDIIRKLLPEDHLLLASSKRVKALVLEEIAIDRDLEDEKLKEAQILHLDSLILAKQAYGDDNVQIAKHFGNLGRLYQSMRRYDVAEEMHKKAIEIKERLLGEEDYEVALSLGHLASLYTYDMNMFEEAEELYLRSISIGRKLFGDGYSGLEYDYRGLIYLYRNIGNYEAMLNYNQILDSWQELRKNIHSSELSMKKTKTSLQATEKVIQEFFNHLE